MGEPRPLSALPTWEILSRAIGKPLGPRARWEAYRERAVHDAADREKEKVAPPAVCLDGPAGRMRAAGAHTGDVEEWLRHQPLDSPAAGYAAAWLREVESAGSPPVLVLTGGAGAGKTLAGLDALAWGCRRPVRRPGVWPAAHWCALPELLPLGEYERPGRDEWDLAMHVYLVVLDDLAAGIWNDYQRGRFERLLSHRLSSGKPTVVTTNLAPEAVLDRRGKLGERVASRLGDKRACRIVQCGTVDLRRQEARR